MSVLTKSITLLLIFLFFNSVLVQTNSFNDRLTDGISLFEKNKLDDARILFEKHLNEHPESAKANYYLGRIFFRKNSMDKAEKNFKRAVKLEAANSVYHTWLGNFYGTKINSVSFFKKPGMAKKIKTHFAKAVELDEDNLDARESLISFYREAPGIVGGGKDKAKKHAAILKEKDKFRGYNAFAQIYEKEKKWDLAEAEYKAAIEEFPERIVARFQVGYYYQRRERFSEAFEIFEKILADSSGNFGALYQIGRTGALSGKNLDRAEECFKQYLQHKPGGNNPSWASAHWRLGMVYERKQQKALAREHYQAALKIEPDYEQVKKALKKLK